MNQSILSSIIVLIYFQIVISNEISIEQPTHETYTISLFSVQNQIQIEQQRKQQLTTRILQNKSGCPNDCNNHGICDNSNNICMCNTNWIGADCNSKPPPEIPNSPPQPVVRTRCQECCSWQMCRHGTYESNSCYCKECPSQGPCCSLGYNCFKGSCMNSQCVCQSGYYGRYCEEGCGSNCQNGDCYYNICKCFSGWEGNNCNIRQCASKCQNNGTCQNGTCKCQAGWGGSDCWDIKCPNDCSGAGTCINDTCNCITDWYGRTCYTSYTIERCKRVWDDYECKCLGQTFGPSCVTCKTCKKDCPEECNKYKDRQDFQKIGIIAGSVVGSILLCCFTIYCCYRQIKQHNKKNKRLNNLKRNIVAPQQNIQAIFGLENEVQQKVSQIQNQIQNDTLHQASQQNSKKQLPPIQNKLKKQIEVKNCSICLDDINFNAEYQVNCPSKHVFHKKCIQQWLLIHQTCPQCRGQIIQ